MIPLTTRLVFTDVSGRPSHARSVRGCVLARDFNASRRLACHGDRLPDIRQCGELRVCGRRKSGGSGALCAVFVPDLMASPLLCGIPQPRGRTLRRGTTMEDLCFEC